MFWFVFLGSNYEITVLIYSCISMLSGSFMVAWLPVLWGFIITFLLSSGFVAVLSLKANFGSSYFYKMVKKWEGGFKFKLVSMSFLQP